MARSQRIAVDTSILLAILFKEPDYLELARVLRINECLISAASLLEAHMVITNRYGESAAIDLDSLIDRVELKIIPVDLTKLTIARRASSKFGRGKHPAKLNFGDCFAYALALAYQIPLAFKGDDFSKTDVLVFKLAGVK